MFLKNPRTADPELDKKSLASLGIHSPPLIPLLQRDLFQLQGSSNSGLVQLLVLRLAFFGTDYIE